MIGVVTESIHFNHHWIFKNYFYSIKNIYGENNVKLIFSENDLYDVDILFIGDENYGPNNIIWNTDSFIKKCNDLEIQICVFNNERIFNGFYPGNIDNLERTKTFNNVIRFVYDVEDSDLLNCGVNKTYMSKEFKSIINITEKEKIDKILFFGNYNGSTYENRKIFISEFQKNFDIDVIHSGGFSMNEYFETISKYKYILSALGNGNMVTMRFFETLFVGSIPLQQSNSKIKEKFKTELDNNIGIFFNDFEELKVRLSEHPEPNKINYFMEDFLYDFVVPYLKK